ncbi:MAG: bifunctional tetrahydrofolate synthase/dihydrofolate synthase [Candidatus Malihini olakiniferum]
MENLHIPQATSPLAAWLYYLEHMHATVIDMGLTRIKQIAENLHLLHPAQTVFTVAGTNGKGTTCCTLEAILLVAGLSVGVYSSPHLLRYTERVRIQGKELSEAKHSQALAEIEAGRGDASLTYFEFGTLAALHLFKQANLDVVILEVGLGGRLDATNIIDADVAAITSIALDHTDWLGHDRESIGHEKAGIFRSMKPAIVGEPDMPASIAAVAEEKGAVLYRRGEHWLFALDGDGWYWQAVGRECKMMLPLPNVPLANAATALAALHQGPIRVPLAAIKQGLSRAALPGRFQTVSEQPKLILDVAHNPHAAAYLAERLAQLPRTGKVRAVIGMLADKDIPGTLAYLKQVVDEWYCAPLEGPRGASAELITTHLVDCSRSFDYVATAWHQAMQEADIQDTVVVCGSFHTIAHVMMALDERRANGK